MVAGDDAGGNGHGTEAALRNAVSTSSSGDVILSANIGTLLTQLTIARSLTLDLSGYTLTIDLQDMTESPTV